PCCAQSSRAAASSMRSSPLLARGLFRLVAERLEEGGLLLAGHDVDALPAAHFLAQLAADAGLLVDLDLAQVLRAVLVRRVDAVEGADVDAHPAAVAVVGVDDRDRALLALEHLGDVAPGIEDGLVGADDAARAAVDAEPGLDQEVEELVQRAHAHSVQRAGVCVNPKVRARSPLASVGPFALRAAGSRCRRSLSKGRARCSGGYRKTCRPTGRTSTGSSTSS